MTSPLCSSELSSDVASPTMSTRGGVSSGGSVILVIPGWGAGLDRENCRYEFS